MSSGGPAARNGSSDEVRKRNAKTTKILMFITVAFGVQWLPYHCFIITTEIMDMTPGAALDSNAKVLESIYLAPRSVALFSCT